jgi:hypothetical protein
MSSSSFKRGTGLEDEAAIVDMRKEKKRKVCEFFCV